MAEIRALISQCSPKEREMLFRELRESHLIHIYETEVGASAEMILEAVHRAPELTRRMLRGVIADAAFGLRVAPMLAQGGWKDVTPEGNYSYDYVLKDTVGSVTVQVKLQRSVKGKPMLVDGAKYGLHEQVGQVETQRTRTGKDGDDNKTRPYRYGEFDVLAVCMQPSSGSWEHFRYTVGRWLAPSYNPAEIATMQPVTSPGEFWTEDFNVVASWLRATDGGKRMTSPASKRPPRVRKRGKTQPPRKRSTAKVQPR